MSDKKSSTSGTDFDASKYRISEQQIDNNLKSAAESTFKTQVDKKTGQESFWGFKISKTAAFAINTLYDNFVLPWTGEGAKHVYRAALQMAERHGYEGKAQQIAGAAALAVRIGGVVIKPAAELISINKDHYSERSELSDKVHKAIEGTPADYSNNEVIKTAYDRVHDDWSRDLTRKIPDIIKTGIQASMAYDMHKVHMEQINPAAAAAAATTAAAGQKKAKDDPTEELRKTIQEMKRNNDPQELINLEIEKHRRKIGLTNPGEEKDLGSKVLTPNISGMLGGITEFSKVAVDEFTERKAGPKENAWDKIQLLKRAMDEMRPGQDADRIKINGVSLKKFIVEIFQQNEIDRGRGRMGDALVEQLMPAVDKIAEHLADTTMDANGLIHLVGDHKIIIHQNEARIFAKEETVEEAISGLRGVNTSKEKINATEFFSNFADPAMAKDLIARNLQTLQGAERSLFIAIFPDELLVQAGMSKEDIKVSRQECHEALYDIVAANTIELAQNDPDQLKQLGLTKTEIQAIQDLGKEIKRGNMDAVKVAVDGSDRTAISALRDAAMHQQLEAKGEASERVWTDMVQKGSSLREKIDQHMETSPEKHKSFAEREKKPAHHVEPRKHLAEHAESHGMSASERVTHRRGKDAAETHTGLAT